MRVFGYELTLRKKQTGYPALYPNQWYPVFPALASEPFAGAWQRNMDLRGESVLGYPAVYACVTRISSDVSKVPVMLVERTDGIWIETESAAFSPVLREPNGYQTQSQFIEQWLFSKLITGNTYVLLKRDNRGVVVEMHILDPRTTKAYVGEDGDIYYQAGRDNLAGLVTNTNRVSAADVIHDRMNPMYHPLCGVTPLTAAGMAAIQGLAIQRQSTGFFQNQAAPSGMLSAEGNMDEATANRIKEHFERSFTGANSGRVVVAGNKLEWKPFTMTATDAEVIKQLQMTATQVCACYQVPAFMVGFGEVPKYDNIEAQIRLYYSQCLQSLTLALEGLLDRGLGLTTAKDGVRYGTMFDLDVLFDMDTFTLIKAMGEAVRGGLHTPNEGRRRLNKPPKDGGDDLMMQEQMHTLRALAERDAGDDPFGTAASSPRNDGASAGDESSDEDAEEQASLGAWLFKMHMDRLAA